MKKADFIEKYKPDELLIKGTQKEINELKAELEVELMSDLDEVIKDELEKFFQSLIGLDIPENNEFIKSYLNSK